MSSRAWVRLAKSTITPRRAGDDPQVFQKIVADLNERIALPYDIGVSFEDCEGPDAFYHKDTHQVTLCHQLIDEYYDLFSRKIKDRAALDDVVRGAAASTFFHEFGHLMHTILGGRQKWAGQSGVSEEGSPRAPVLTGPE